MLHTGTRSLMSKFGRAFDPVAGGRLMWLASGMVVIIILPLLDHQVWRSLALGTALFTAGMLMLSYLMPWSKLPRRTTLLFPLIMCLGITLLGTITHGIAASYSGLFVFCFAYIGLSQPSGTSVLFAPIAIATYITAWGGVSEAIVARLMIAVAVWLLLAELLASFVVRQRLLTDELRRLAHVDPLTNLANRRDLDLRLSEATSGDTLIICDLDHFKRLNDTQGHAAGDRVLAEFGLVVRSCLRQQDYAARYGGEEFALILPGTSRLQAARTLQRLRECWAPLQPEITFSSGVATCAAGQSNTETLFEADQALYAAKAAGRNQDHGSDGLLSQVAVKVLV
jgi:diguanylate cyclase (GGDEF)-like protein